MDPSPSPPLKRLRVVEYLLMALMAVGLYFVVMGAPGETTLARAVDPLTLQQGQLVPSYQLTDLAGRALGSEAWAGKVAVFHFWGTRCGPCIKEMPEVNVLYSETLANDARVVFVSFASDQNKAAVERFVRGRGVPFPVIANTDAEAYRVWETLGVSETPTTILVDPSGHVRWRGAGMPRNLPDLIDAVAGAGR